jgi:hypothetical protein
VYFLSKLHCLQLKSSEKKILLENKNYFAVKQSLLYYQMHGIIRIQSDKHKLLFYSSCKAFIK